MSVLGEDLAAVARGEGRVVVLEGEAGIGKTRLLEEALGGARARVYRGAAEELSGNLPFGVVVDALGIDLRAAPLGRLLLSATGESAEAGGLSFRVSEALLAHVDHLCADGPMALVLEDLHWADASSLVLISRLARRARQLALLLVVTRRPSPERPALDRLVRGLGDGLARRIVLGRLSEGDIHSIAHAFLGAEPGERLVGHLAGAAGNPLFVTELLEAMQRGGDLLLDADGTVDLVGGLLPTSFAVLVLHRLSFLPTATIDALRVAALLGATFSVSELSRVVPLSPSAAVLALRPAAVAGVLDDAGDRFRFRHDLIREALYLDMPGPLRNHLHLEVARSLISVDAPPERVAEHLLRGASPDDRDAGPA
ncbi:MAG TPA: AAA family ATPase, partial [Acidimicrobiia bacterium]